MLLFGFNGRATRNFLILLLSMHYILFIDRVNLAAAAPVMQQDLGLSNLALGLAFSAFNYSYAPFQLVGGWFADRFGARRTLTVCGLAWSLTTIATGAVTGLASLFGVRLVLGMGEGATLPAATRAVSKWTPIEARHRDRGHPRRRTPRRGNGGADRRPSDHLVLLAFFIRRGRHSIDSLGGRVVVVFLRGSAPAPAHHQRRARRIANY